MEKETKAIQVEIGNTYKRRDGLEAFVFYKNPVKSDFQCVVVGENAMFYSVEEHGIYNEFSDFESPNDLIELVK